MQHQFRPDMPARTGINAGLVIEYFITVDFADGRPVPPCDDFLWALVRPLPGMRSLWRRICCFTAGAS